MDGEDPRRTLRGATYRGDGTAVVGALRRLDAREHLQIGGDGLLVAVSQRADGASELATEWVELLRERDREGDAELADQLEAGLGAAPTPMLRPLPVDLDQLADVLEGDPSSPGGRIDLTTGDVVPLFDDQLDPDADEDDERTWLEAPSHGSRSAYRDMEAFIATVVDEERRDRLEIAVQGRGAFRRFRDVLARWDGERTRWHTFSEERRTGRARAWLAEQGYTVAPRRR
jgi:hypothetical protein